VRKFILVLIFLCVLVTPLRAQFGTWYYKWDPWVVEAGSGLVVATVVQPLPSKGWPGGEGLRIVATQGLSVLYECSGLDRNGCELKDLWQRAVFTGVGLVAWHYLRKALHW
jgi:hypothetical protein